MNEMTQLRIIARLWGHITDLRMLAHGIDFKTLDKIEAELEETEKCCEKYLNEEDG